MPNVFTRQGKAATTLTGSTRSIARSSGSSSSLHSASPTPPPHPPTSPPPQAQRTVEPNNIINGNRVDYHVRDNTNNPMRPAPQRVCLFLCVALALLIYKITQRDSGFDYSQIPQSSGSPTDLRHLPEQLAHTLDLIINKLDIN